MGYIFYFIITIGILVFVHEFGHFASAKICKMRVDVFAIGFGKRLLGWNKKTGFSFGELPKDFDGEGNTDYRISLLPLGGYVKIAGMIDESNDKEFLNHPPMPYEFRSKPTYQKLFVIVAGVTMNLILTLAIFFGLNLYQGREIIKTTKIGTVETPSLAYSAGFSTGDSIVSVAGTQVKSWDEVLSSLMVKNLGQDKQIVIIRNGSRVSLNIKKSVISEALKDQEHQFLPISYMRPKIVDVLKDSPASDAGIKKGDILLRMKGIELQGSSQVIKIVTDSKKIQLPLILLRGKDSIKTSVTPGLEGKIGVQLGDDFSGPVEHISYGVMGSLSQGTKNIGQYTNLIFSMLGNVITGKVAFGQVFGGPVKIAQAASRSADSGLLPFIYFIAMLSLSLAIMNIIPFPVLDGGQFCIILIEGIVRHELPIKVKVAIQNTGFVLLLLLMAFIIYSDIISFKQ